MKIEERVISKVRGKGIPKPADDQNTDDIVPARYLKEITFKKMGDYIYYDERHDENGDEINEHPFHKYSEGTILAAGANYGCGSSREHAPQALKRFGIKGIVAVSFAEIFAGNCASLGILGVTAGREDIEKLVKSIEVNPAEEIVIDLKNMEVSCQDFTFDCKMPEGRRQSFLNGLWDGLTILEKNEESILRAEKELKYLEFN